jgi:hypothetical protein
MCNRNDKKPVGTYPENDLIRESVEKYAACVVMVN